MSLDCWRKEGRKFTQAQEESANFTQKDRSDRISFYPQVKWNAIKSHQTVSHGFSKTKKKKKKDVDVIICANRGFISLLSLLFHALLD